MAIAFSKRRDALFVAAAPALFVLLWSTGFIGAKLGAPYAPPLKFLAIRFAIVAAVLWSRREKILDRAFQGADA